MKCTATLTATLFVIEVSLSYAALTEGNSIVEEKRNAVDQRKVVKPVKGIETTRDFANGKKNTKLKDTAAKKRVEFDEDETKQQEEETEKVLGMKKEPVKVKSIPKAKTPVKRKPTKQAVIKAEIDKIEKSENRYYDEKHEEYEEEDKPKSGKKGKQSDLDLKEVMAPINPEHLTGFLEVLQEIRLPIRKLANMLDGPMAPILENLSSLLSNGLPKISDFQSTNSRNNAGKLMAAPAKAYGSANISLPSCRIKDPNMSVNDCLKTYLQKAVKYFKEGNSEYEIPPLDPFQISSIVIPIIPMGEGMYPKSGFDLRTAIKSGEVAGFSDAIITKVESDPENGVFDINYVVPVVKCQLLYSADVVLPTSVSKMKSEGKFELSFIELNHSLSIRGKVKDYSDGTKYLHVSSVYVRMNPAKMNFKFDEYFKGNEQYNQIFNQKLNEYWRAAYQAIQPQLEEDMGNYLLKIISQFFRAVPYNEIFPDV